jgi:hypothetical protein
MKNADALAVKREAEEEWGAITWTDGCRSYFSFPCWQLFVVA